MLSGEVTKAAIIDVATNLFFERGYYGANMREIAEGVGIRPASIYNHVASKEDLLFVIAMGSIQELYDLGVEATSSSDDPTTQLVGLIRSHVKYHAHSAHRAKVSDDQLHALEPEHLAEVLVVRDRYELLLKDILSSGITVHGWHVDDLAVTTFAFWTMCTAVGAWYRPDGRLNADEVADIYAGIVLSAVNIAVDVSPAS